MDEANFPRKQLLNGSLQLLNGKAGAKRAPELCL